MQARNIRVGIVGYGNLGKGVELALRQAEDMALCAVFTRRNPETLEIWSKDVPVFRLDEVCCKAQELDVLILCGGSANDLPVQTPELAKYCNTVDSFDIHTGIVDLRRTLDATAKEHKAVSIISAGWDPGSDSIVRTMLEAIAPKGITYTNFGPGMSMGHTVAVKAIDGVKAALSMTIPTGTGIHRRMVYIELKDGYKFEEVAAAIKADPYFVNDETHVKLVPSVDALLDMGHGVNLTRKGVSGKTQNQLFEFNMRINNPALTAQVLVCVARASMKQQPGCYTMVEVPVIDLLPGDREEWIGHLV